MFVKVSHEVLKQLADKGYNILTSVNTVDEENPTFMPARVNDVWEYLDGLSIIPMEEPAILVIDDALKNINDSDLKGVVWTGDV